MTTTKIDVMTNCSEHNFPSQVTYPDTIGWTTKQLVEFCKKNNSYDGMIEEISKAKSPEDWWDTTDRADWMQWFSGRLYKEPDGFILDDFKFKSQVAWAEYKRVMGQYRDDFAGINVGMWEYKCAMTSASIEYGRSTANIWRNLVPNPFV